MYGIKLKYHKNVLTHCKYIKWLAYMAFWQKCVPTQKYRLSLFTPTG